MSSMPRGPRCGRNAAQRRGMRRWDRRLPPGPIRTARRRRVESRRVHGGPDRRGPPCARGPQAVGGEAHRQFSSAPRRRQRNVAAGPARRHGPAERAKPRKGNGAHRKQKDTGSFNPGDLIARDRSATDKRGELHPIRCEKRSAISAVDHREERSQPQNTDHAGPPPAARRVCRLRQPRRHCQAREEQRQDPDPSPVSTPGSNVETDPYHRHAPTLAVP